MQKYLVIGNPIDHSLSPKIHNYWFKKNNIDATYEKKQVNENDIKNIVFEVKNGKIDGLNVTVPFKKKIIHFLDRLTPHAKESNSVNTIFKKDNLVFGDNTDIDGFKYALNHINYSFKNKKVFILGSGGVVPSIILALKKLNVSSISLSNRTRQRAEELKRIHKNIEIIDWGQNVNFDIIINATSIGLKKNEKINLDLSKAGINKLFYDVIYNPNKTNFLLKGEKLGNQIENGKMMFIYQAQLAFNIWHNILPKIDDETIKLLET